MLGGGERPRNPPPERTTLNHMHFRIRHAPPHFGAKPPPDQPYIFIWGEIWGAHPRSHPTFSQKIALAVLESGRRSNQPDPPRSILNFSARLLAPSMLPHSGCRRYLALPLVRLWRHHWAANCRPIVSAEPDSRDAASWCGDLGGVVLRRRVETTAAGLRRVSSRRVSATALPASAPG